jgi:hypothetical protein
MGQPVTVIEKASATAGVVRYETNRVLTGTGHETYRSLDDAVGNKWCDELARRLFGRGGVASVHMNGNVITLHLLDDSSAEGIKEIVEDMFLYYREGVVPEIPAGVATDS